MTRTSTLFLSLPLTLILASSLCAEGSQGGLARRLGQLRSSVFDRAESERRSSMLGDDIRDRRDALNQLNRRSWARINSRSAWEKFVRRRIDLLEQSLGPPSVGELVTEKRLDRIQGDGFVVEKIVYASRPGMWVTANLYRPDPPRESMPGILISHSHHRPKTQGEIQDMGMTWARAGCLVLAPDHLGHGERQQHGFDSAVDFEREFRVSRQDYYFRYDNGIQLHLAGESLIGQFVYDLRRGVSVLLAQEGIAADKIILLGAVAGGAEPAAVAAALDERVACVCPFNFGGPQMPGRRYPLPEDIEQTMNYVGSGSWESTRNLQRSGADGFLPWTIVASIAPRRLIYAHEFAWHRERDPIWARLQTIYDFYGVPENLGYTHGRGDVKLRPPAATHCTQIGLEHREMIHPLLNQWFGIEASAETEYSARLDEQELLCLDEQSRSRFMATPLNEILQAKIAREHAALRRRLEDLPREQRREAMRKTWRRVLGDYSSRPPLPVPDASMEDLADGFVVERIALNTRRNIFAPVLLIRPETEDRKKPPVAVIVCQEGKQALLEARNEEIARLLSAGIAVCLVDLAGTGETSPGGERGRQSTATNLSSSALMLGRNLLTERLYDLRTVLRYVRGRRIVDNSAIALWGDSCAPVNERDAKVLMPRGIDERPHQSEPLGETLVLLAALIEDDLAAVVVNRGIVSYASVLDLPHVFIPHDIVVPGMLECGDLCDLAAAAAPTPLYLGELVDGANRVATDEARREAYAPAVAAYQSQDAPSALTFADGGPSATEWLIGCLGQ